MAAPTPGSSRLGGGSCGEQAAAAAAKPAVQLHDLQGSLLKRLLAAEAAAAAAAPAPREMAVAGGQQQQQLPLDSTPCTEFRVPDLPATAAAAAAAPGSNSPAAAAAVAGAPEQQQQQPVAAAAPPPLLGWQELRQRMLDAGANPAYASQAWAKNHYRWVVWKLARLQLLRTPASSSRDGKGSSSGSGGSNGQVQLLTAAVVLDELKYR
jgi:hypothetical protein